MMQTTYTALLPVYCQTYLLLHIVKRFYCIGMPLQGKRNLRTYVDSDGLPVGLKLQLVPRKMLKDELAGLLHQGELATLAACLHRPNHVLQMISGIIQSCHLSDVQIALMVSQFMQ